MTDRETGRQKGFAFIEYYDWQTAQSATRNLDGHDINGRKVVVKFAEKDHDSLPRPNRGAGLLPLARLACFPTEVHSPIYKNGPAKDSGHVIAGHVLGLPLWHDLE